MKPADVVMLFIPQADGLKKKRPVVLVKEVPPFSDWLVIPISTQLRHAVAGLDMIVNEGDANYRRMQLRKPSLVRLAQIHVVPLRKIGVVIGSMDTSSFQQLRQSLAMWLQKD